MLELIAIGYDDETAADRALDELRRGADRLAIDPDACSVVICERDGGCRLTTSHSSGATARWSGFWGTLLEALLAGERTPWVDSPFQRRLRRMIHPGSSLLLVASRPSGGRSIIDALSQFGGAALSTELRGGALDAGAGHGRPRA